MISAPCRVVTAFSPGAAPSSRPGRLSAQRGDDVGPTLPPASGAASALAYLLPEDGQGMLALVEILEHAQLGMARHEIVDPSPATEKEAHPRRLLQAVVDGGVGDKEATAWRQ